MKLFLFPQIKNKKLFLLEFLENFAPSIVPEVFPYSTRFNWLNDKDYWLPNHSKLIEERKTDKKGEIIMAIKDLVTKKNVRIASYVLGAVTLATLLSTSLVQVVLLAVAAALYFASERL